MHFVTHLKAILYYTKLLLCVQFLPLPFPTCWRLDVLIFHVIVFSAQVVITKGHCSEYNLYLLNLNELIGLVSFTLRVSKDVTNLAANAQYILNHRI